MSRTTVAINRIKEELDSISGLDGIVADIIEDLDIEVHYIVEKIRKEYSNASIVDYLGTSEHTE